MVEAEPAGGPARSAEEIPTGTPPTHSAAPPNAQPRVGSQSNVAGPVPPESTIGTGLGRALARPMRAVSRVFGSAPNPSGGTRLRGRGGTGQRGAGTPRRRTGRMLLPSSIVDCGLYVDGVRQAGQWTYTDALAAARRRHDAFVWLGVHEPGAAEFADIAAVFQLDEFAVEDAVVGAGRPKIERSGDATFLVLRTARYIEHQELTETSEVVETGDIMIFVGTHFVITVRHGDANSLAPVRHELEAQPDLLQLGPWAVVYAISDRVVDTYLDVAAMVEVDIDAVEVHVFSRDTHNRIQRIYQLKRELVEFKRAVVPLQRPLLSLVEGRLGVSAEIARFFRDVHENLVKTVEQVVSFDDLLNSILQARLAQVTVDQNNDMRKIAAWAAIAAMQTAIAGVYGMNFHDMPELRWEFGYPTVLIVMLGSAIALYLLFRRSGWL
jgi:magnesium transporter